MLLRVVSAFLIPAILFAGSHWYINAQLPWHAPELDQRGKLLSWYQPKKNLGYDEVLHLGWNFIEHKVGRDTKHHTGLKIYLINSVFDSETLQGSYWQNNPAMVFAAFVDGLVSWYPYSGDAESIQVVREMLDYQLAHGTTPADWEWPGVPFATSCGDQPDYGHCLQDTPHEFYGGIETDKIGQLGLGYTQFYEMTGKRQYLDAALRCANALARHVRAGDSEHTPWPFRVDARTGVTLPFGEYGGDTASSLRMFDELIRLRAGDMTAFSKARDSAWQWILHNPLSRDSKAWDRWEAFFEDVPYRPGNVNQFVPDMLAYYILSREDPATVDSDWQSHVGHLIDWVRLRFGRGPFLGAWAIDEQGTPDGRGCCSRAGLGSHTSRWAAINALFAERTGDAQAREDAFRSLNYATYFARSDGQISCCGSDFKNSYWFSDGYADYLRHFNWAMGGLPELAPVGQDHLLRSTSVVQKIAYAPRRVSYKTFEPEGKQVLRLSFKPTRITADGSPLAERNDLKEPGYTLEPLSGGDYVVRVRHETGSEITIQGS